MKKYIAIVILCLTGLNITAQIQRNVVKQKSDSTVTEPTQPKQDGSRKELLRELDLTKEQKIKMKEINQTMKLSKDAIENDTTLNENEKKEKLKVLRKEQVTKIQAILTEEQKIKFRQLRAKKNENG